MIDFGQLVTQIAPVILLILLGALLRKLNILETGAVESIKRLVVNVTLPALLFLAFAGVDFESRYFALSLTVFGVCVVMLFLGRGLGKLLKIRSPYFPLLLTGFEAGMLGYSLYVTVFGTESTFKFAVVDLGQVTFVFFVLMGLLIKYRDGLEKTSTLLRTFIKSPVIIAIFLGILFGSTGAFERASALSAGSGIVETLRLLSSLTAPLILLVIGCEIRVDIRNLRLPLITVALRVPILTGLAWLVNELVVRGWLGLDRGFVLAVWTMFILPPPFIIPLFLRKEDEDNRQYILNTLSLHTLVTLALFAVVVALSGPA